MAKPKHANYRLDRLGVFRTSGGEADYCRLPCMIYTDAGNFVCKTQSDVEKAVRLHCHAVGIFDPEPIIQWAMETEVDAINPQMIKGGGQHTGVDDGWLVF
ncbi:hypothetical protein [Actibacterium sp. D379-3]